MLHSIHGPNDSYIKNASRNSAGGFGYDPIFLFSELGKTMAELIMDEKNRLSHRAKAVMKAKGKLKELIAKAG